MAHGEAEIILLPALDNPGGGVQWVSVTKMIKVIADAGNISKQLRASLKARLSTGDGMRALNTLTVLHTVSLNCSKGVCKQLAETRYMRMLERAFTDFDISAVKAAVVQILVDWKYLFSGEDLGSRSEKTLKVLKSKGAKPIKPSSAATERREDIAKGVTNQRFARGLDFGLMAAGDPSKHMVSPRTLNTNKFARMASKLFSRNPGSSQAEAAQTASKTAALRSKNIALPAQVEEMLHQMPSDGKKLQDLVSDMLVLLSKDGDDNDIKNKYAVAQSLASKCKACGVLVKHIINTNVEDVSMDFLEGTPRAGKAFGKEGKLQLDSTALTRILDANDKVQMALKGWYELENKMKAEWVKHGLEHSGLGELAGHSDKEKASMSVKEAISHQLHAVHRIPGLRGEANCVDHIDSMSSDATQSHSFTLPVATNTSNGMNLWVDFSDSSGSQISRQSPAAAGNPAWRAPFAFSTPREAWAAAPRRSSAKGRIGGSTSPDLSSSATERPHSVVSGTIVPHLNWSSPFTSTAAVYGTPRLVQSEVFSRKSELQATSSVTRYQGDKLVSDRECSEYTSCGSRDYASGAWPAPKSSLRERFSGLSDTVCSTDEHPTRNALSLESDVKQICHSEANVDSQESQDEQMDGKTENPIDFVKKTHHVGFPKSAPGTPLATGLERNSWHFADSSLYQPAVAKKRKPTRRIPPALRVRFTPEHLKDVLLRVDEHLNIASRTAHCKKMPVTRF